MHVCVCVCVCMQMGGMVVGTCPSLCPPGLSCVCVCFRLLASRCQMGKLSIFGNRRKAKATSLFVTFLGPHLAAGDNVAGAEFGLAGVCVCV